MQLLKTESEICHPLKTDYVKEAYCSFWGDTLKWLTGTATMRDMHEIKQCVNQLIQEHT